jgi:hypothetical protein
MEKPDPVWKLSMLSRAMLDFNIMLNAEGPAPFFRNLETMKDLHEEQKRLALKINIFYAVTFIGALLVLSGPLPTEAKISAFGIEAPLGALPQQVIAVMMAVAYSIFGTHPSKYEWENSAGRRMGRMAFLWCPVRRVDLVGHSDNSEENRLRFTKAAPLDRPCHFSGIFARCHSSRLCGTDRIHNCTLDCNRNGRLVARRLWWNC